VVCSSIYVCGDYPSWRASTVFLPSAGRAAVRANLIHVRICVGMSDRQSPLNRTCQRSAARQDHRVCLAGSCHGLLLGVVIAARGLRGTARALRCPATVTTPASSTSRPILRGVGRSRATGRLRRSRIVGRSSCWREPSGGIARLRRVSGRPVHRLANSQPVFSIPPNRC